MAAKIDGVQSTLYGMIENAQEVYIPANNTPAPSHTVRLDFGNASTPEGLLKKSVLCGESSEIVPAAAGAINLHTGFLEWAVWKNCRASRPRAR